MGAHLINGKFQSDKYPTCPAGKVPLSCNDPDAQDLLWTYAQRRRGIDAEFADDLEEALRLAGYTREESPNLQPGDIVYREGYSTPLTFQRAGKYYAWCSHPNESNTLYGYNPSTLRLTPTTREP